MERSQGLAGLTGYQTREVTMSSKSVKGKADMKHPLQYKITVADKSDTGSVMDTARPQSPHSPFFPISKPFYEQEKGK